MQVAALAIIMIRGLDLLMIFNTLGVSGTMAFIQRSVQTSNLTLVFLSSLILVFIEIYCAFSLVKGRNWARWIYLFTRGGLRLFVGGIVRLWLSRAVQYCG